MRIRAIRPSVTCRRYAAACSILLICWFDAFGSVPALSLQQLDHRVWKEQEGAPRGIAAAQQMDDGSLLLTAGGGDLYRFDGTFFTRLSSIGGEALKDRLVYRLFPGPNGAVFVSFGPRGLGMIKDGLYRDVEHSRDFPRIRTMQAAEGGVAWAVAEGRLLRIADGRAAAIGAESGFFAKSATGLTVDRDGTVWVSAEDDRAERLFYRKRDDVAFREAPESPGSDLAAGPDGSIWGCSTSGLRVVIVKDGAPVRVQRISSVAVGPMTFDSTGGMWLASRDFGLLHVAAPARLLDADGARVLQADAMTAQTGLTSDWVTNFAADRDDNVWVTTAGGLERFQRTALTPVRTPGRPIPWAILPGPDGKVWGASWSTPLALFGAAGVERTFVKDVQATHLYRDPDGVVRVGTAEGPGHLEAGAKIVIDSAPPQSFADSGVRTLLALDEQHLVASPMNGMEAQVLSAGQWQPVSKAFGWPTGWTAASMIVDDRRRLWASSGDRLLVMEGQDVSLDPGRGAAPGVGTILALSARGPRLWVGGRSGIALFDGRRFIKLEPAVGPPFAVISGILERANGDLWFRGLNAAWHVDKRELEAFLDGRSKAVAAERFDSSDGLKGLAGAPRPNFVEASDGRLWFSTDVGFAYIDADRRVRVREPQRVTIDQIQADGKPYEPGPTIALEPQNRQLEIGYSAVNLTHPERVRFRYRLEGIDADWQEAGVRRVALYNTLPPGRYRFSVGATSEDGRWSEASSVVAFTVPPAWYQTGWFRLACALLVLAVVWLAFALRSRREVARMQLGFQARQSERERIARDLHDTLLQSVYGTSLRLQAVLAGMDVDDPNRGKLSDELDRAEASIIEARRKVLDLRGEDGEGDEFSGVLVREAEALSRDFLGKLEVSVTGEPRELVAEVRSQTSQIVREALLNAFRHSNASQVTLRIGFLPAEFHVRVADNGMGMDPVIVERGRVGHWGLAGMQERALAANGVLRLDSRPGAGTVVDLRFYARHAYAAQASGALWRRWRPPVFRKRAARWAPTLHPTRAGTSTSSGPRVRRG